jgi:hypothetical protein
MKSKLAIPVGASARRGGKTELLATAIQSGWPSRAVQWRPPVDSMPRDVRARCAVLGSDFPDDSAWSVTSCGADVRLERKGLVGTYRWAACQS